MSFADWYYFEAQFSKNFFEYFKNIIFGLFSAAFLALLVTYYDYSKQLIKNVVLIAKANNQIYQSAIYYIANKTVILAKLPLERTHDEIEWILYLISNKRTKRHKNVFSNLDSIRKKIEQILLIINQISSIEYGNDVSIDSVVNNQMGFLTVLQDFLDDNHTIQKKIAGELKNIKRIKKRRAIEKNHLKAQYKKLRSYFDELKLLNDELLLLLNDQKEISAG